MTGANDGRSVRAPGWFIAAVVTAATLIGIGWAASELRHRDIEGVRGEMQASDLSMARSHQALLDSLGRLAQQIQVNTFRLCRLEVKANLPIALSCAQFGTSIR